MMTTIEQASEAISAVCPIDGISSEGRIDFRSNATALQKSAAQQIMDQWLAGTLPAAPQRIVVTPWQIRKALNQTGLRAAVEASIAGADQTTKDGWEFATEFVRTDPLVEKLGFAIGKSDAEIDALFALALTL